MIFSLQIAQDGVFMEAAGKVFFDANVWLAYFKRAARFKCERWEQDYADFFSRCLTSESSVIVFNAVLYSEIQNAFVRIAKAQQTQLNQTLTKDEQRNSASYQSASAILGSHIDAWMRNGKIKEEALSCTVHVVRRYSAKITVDFNDVTHYLFCAEHQLPLVTNDKDFKAIDDALSAEYPVSMYTYNRVLLQG